jgi:hypothetical protein
MITDPQQVVFTNWAFHKNMVGFEILTDHVAYLEPTLSLGHARFCCSLR